MRARLRRLRAPVAFGIVIVFGLVLRLLWVGDMEYKADEAYVAGHALGAHPWPVLGERSSVGVPNPPLGTWGYSLLSRVLDIHHPVGLARAVIVLNALALLGLCWLVLRVVPWREREQWQWSAALTAVNPVSILFSRKLWINTLLPPLTLGLLLAWFRRRCRSGSFVLGLLSLLLGQIHLSGFFFAGGIVLWTALFDRSSVRWRWWLCGAFLGSAPMIPWAIRVAEHAGNYASSGSFAPRPAFWFVWIGYGLGLVLSASFGGDLDRFLRWPVIDGSSLHLVLVTGLGLVLVGLMILVVVVAPHLRRPWSRLSPRRAARDESGLLHGATFLGFGLLLTATGVAVGRQYLIVAFPLPLLTLSRAALRRRVLGRPLLLALVILQSALSVQYLTYIHAHHGAPRGDYGVSYDAQRHPGG